MSNTVRTTNKFAPWLCIAVGILLIIFKARLINWVLTVIGAALLISGIADIVNKRTADGVIGIIAGVVAIVGGWLFVDIALIILGVCLAAKGVLELVDAVKFKDGIGIAAAIITVIVGIMLFIGRWATLDWMFIIIGIIFIANGLFLLKDCYCKASL